MALSGNLFRAPLNLLDILPLTSIGSGLHPLKATAVWRESEGLEASCYCENETLGKRCLKQSPLYKISNGKPIIQLYNSAS